MKTNIISIAVLFLTTLSYAEIAGSFIQLNRDKAARTVEDWRGDFRQIKSMGGDTLIVQWSAEEPVLYFEADGLRGFTETYPVLELWRARCLDRLLHPGRNRRRHLAHARNGKTDARLSAAHDGNPARQ
jgi:hypothetical protein